MKVTGPSPEWSSLSSQPFVCNFALIALGPGVSKR